MEHIRGHSAIVLEISGDRLYKPVDIKKDEIDKLSYLKLSFANKGLDGINVVVSVVLI